MKIHLDNCCFNRPYDDPNYGNIYLETQAKLQIQERIKNKQIDLIWSTMIDFENSKNPEKVVQLEIANWRNLAVEIVHQDQQIIDYANKLMRIGLHKKDALHISCAVAVHCDYFITVDKGIIKKMTQISEIVIINTIDFIHILEAQK
ncbi:MAG: PIN domain protein [Spirochaetia bacterium]|nr:PIN domain protein [Spirochaetia bacterium]